MTPRFAGRTALVTGGTGGMGAEVARRLVREGASVVVGDLAEDALAALGDELGPSAVVARCDVTVEDDVERLVETAVASFGRLDLAFNVAGSTWGALLVDTTEEVWRRNIDLNLTGVFFSVKHEARQMIRQGGGGAIVNVASIAGSMSVPWVGAYSASKAGVEMLSRVAAGELGEHGIRVNSISPGRTVTRSDDPLADSTKDPDAATTPLGRIGVPTDMASAMLWLASDDAGFVSGADLTVDGGFSAVSHLDLRYLGKQHPAG